MSLAHCADGTGKKAIRPTVTQRAAEGLALAAAPTFALMALLTAGGGESSMAMMCSSTAGQVLNSMTTMYLLMSAFHLAPWLKLLRSGAHREREEARR